MTESHTGGDRPSDRLGRDVALLLYDSGWLQCRKDTVELLDDAWVRRQTSIDCIIPRSLEPLAAKDAAEPMYLLPIALLPKIPPALMRFDFYEGDRRAALPRREQNALASYAALLHAAGAALGRPPRTLPARLREELLFVAAGPPEYAEPFARRLRAPSRGLPEIPHVKLLPSLTNAEAELDDWWAQLSSRDPPSMREEVDGPISDQELVGLNRQLAQDPMTSWFLKVFAAASVVLAHVECGPSRHKIVRLAYDSAIFKDEQRVGQHFSLTLGWESIPLVIETPYVGAHSYHFEFIGTDSVEVIGSQLLEPSPSSGVIDGDVSAVDGWESRFSRHDSSRVHHYWANASSVDSVSAIVRLRVARANFVGPAFWAACAVALTILACGLLAQPLVRHGTGAPTFLLLFPGLAATLIAGAARHPLIARVLQRARSALLLSALLSFLAAGILPLIHTGGGANAAWWVRGLWLAFGALALLPVGLLYLARRLPRPEGEEGRLERMNRWLQRRIQESARRRARRRQRQLQLIVRAPALTWQQANDLSERSTSSRRFLIEPGDHRRWGRSQTPYLLLKVEPDSRGRKPRRTPLRTSARATDRVLEQPLEMRRRLSATALWLQRQLPEGYSFEARWHTRARVLEELVAKVPSLRWLSSANDEPVRCTDEQFAADLRAGKARMNHVYDVMPEQG